MLRLLCLALLCTPLARAQEVVELQGVRLHLPTGWVATGPDDARSADRSCSLHLSRLSSVPEEVGVRTQAELWEHNFFECGPIYRTTVDGCAGNGVQAYRNDSDPAGPPRTQRGGYRPKDSTRRALLGYPTHRPGAVQLLFTLTATSAAQGEQHETWLRETLPAILKATTLP